MTIRHPRILFPRVWRLASRQPFEIALLASGLAAALLLRIWRIETQPIVGDEMHGLRASARDMGYIVTHTHLGNGADYSIPVTLWNRLLVESIGLTEAWMRLPMMLSGFALVVVMAVFAWRAFGRLEGAITACVMGASPVLIYYSRFARPYAMAVLFTVLTLGAWLWYLREGRRLAGIATALCGAIATWFSLTAAPSVACLWALGCAASIARPRWSQAEAAPIGKRALLRWSGFVLLGVVAAALLHYPSAASQADFVASKAQGSEVTWSRWLAAARILFGTRNLWVLAWLVGLTALGAIVSGRRRPVLLLAISAMGIGQAIAVRVIAPEGMDDSLVLARYLLVAAPGMLLLMCVGLGAGARQIGAFFRHTRAPVPIAACAGLLVVVGSGPLSGAFRARHTDTSHLFWSDDSEWEFHRDRMPPFYESLRESDSNVVLAEVPWGSILTQYQEFHGRQIKTVDLSRNPREGLRRRATMSWSEVVSGAGSFRYLVLHKDLRREALAFAGLPAVLGLGTHVDFPYPQTTAHGLQRIKRQGRLREIYEDPWIIVFENPG